MGSIINLPSSTNKNVMKKQLLLYVLFFYSIVIVNAQSWQELSGGAAFSTNFQFNAIATDTSGNIYAAGSITNDNGYEYVVKWNGSSWVQLGTGNTFNYWVGALVVDRVGNLYAAGGFTDANGKSYVAKW